ncbi:hypothetical protein WNZ15_13770 [Roseibium sp. AS2]|uniref:uridine kinase family protein n=1 Tax=Roseibium sp. AS2 TaxID=3135781 RepID=UPI00317151E1
MSDTQKPVRDITTLTARVQEGARHRDSVFVAVSGFAGAGKTTLCRSLMQALAGKACHFECDRFSSLGFKDRERRIAEQTGDGGRAGTAENPQHWYDWNEIEKALSALRRERRLEFNRAWNPDSGELDACYTLDLGDSRPAVVLCDGIFLLHEAVRSWFDATIFVDCPEPLRRARGLRRTQDPDRRDYMNRLERIHCEPYFREFSPSANIVYNPSGTA